jgi:hypothetical protein
MFIPGELVAVLTFPGVIVHEAAHQLFCRFFRVAVLDVCYIRYGRPSGYVVHETATRPGQHVWISVGPFLVNTLVGALIAAPAAIPVIRFEAGDPLDYLLIWLGVSVAMHAFPSTGDAQAIRRAMKSPNTSVLTKVIAAPIVAVIYLGAAGSIFWLDAVYGVVVAMLLPNLVIWLAA